MIITEIKKQVKNNGRFNIYLDYNYYCALNAETIVKNGLKTGLEITQDQIDTYQLESEKTTALEKLVKYMGTRLRTEKQLKDYLKSKGYAEKTVDYCMSKLKEYNFINDEQYVTAYIESNKNKKGKTLLKQELKQKGIGEKLLEDNLAEYETDEKAIENLANKYLKNKQLSKDNFSKVYRYLFSKGFGSDEILRVIKRIFNNDECGY